MATRHRLHTASLVLLLLACLGMPVNAVGQSVDLGILPILASAPWSYQTTITAPTGVIFKATDVLVSSEPALNSAGSMRLDATHWSLQLAIDPIQLRTLGPKTLVIRDSEGGAKLQIVLELRSAAPILREPCLMEVLDGPCVAELRLPTTGDTKTYHLRLQGGPFYQGTALTFSDSYLTVLAGGDAPIIQPTEILAKLRIRGDDPPGVGAQQFELTHAHAPTATGSVFVRGLPPTIADVSGVRANESFQTVTVRGSNFARNLRLQATTLGAHAQRSVKYVSPTEATFEILPHAGKATSYPVELTNPGETPPARGSISAKVDVADATATPEPKLFATKQGLVTFRFPAGTTLDYNKRYTFLADPAHVPGAQGISLRRGPGPNTLEAELVLPWTGTKALATRKVPFSLAEDDVVRWSGEIEVTGPPELDAGEHPRIVVYPGDTVDAKVSGRRLAGVVVSGVEGVEVLETQIEGTSRLTVKLVSSPDVRSYELPLQLEGNDFTGLPVEVVERPNLAAITQLSTGKAFRALTSGASIDDEGRLRLRLDGSQIPASRNPLRVRIRVLGDSLDNEVIADTVVELRPAQEWESRAYSVAKNAVPGGTVLVHVSYPGGQGVAAREELGVTRSVWERLNISSGISALRVGGRDGTRTLSDAMIGVTFEPFHSTRIPLGINVSAIVFTQKMGEGEDAKNKVRWGPGGFIAWKGVMLGIGYLHDDPELPTSEGAQIPEPAQRIFFMVGAKTDIPLPKLGG